MSKVLISYLITDLSTGGSPLALQRLLSAIDRNRFNPSVICFFYRDGYIANEIKNLHIPVINLRMTNKGRFDIILRLSRLLHDTKPDILHTWLFHANITGRILGRLNKVPIIIASRRSVNIGGVWRETLMRRTSGMNDKIIAVSEAARKAEIERSNVSSDKVVTIYNGLDPSPYNSVSDEAGLELRNSLGIPDDALLLGAIGRLHPSKGFNDLISAMVQLKAENNSIRLLIVGEGKLLNYLKLHVYNNNLSETIKFTGMRNDIPVILSALNVLVSPSLWEGLPNVVLEAMAAGKPVVATSVGGTPEAVVDGVTGLLVPPQNPEALANAILLLLENSELRIRMGRAGRERVLNHFSIQRMVKRTEQLYQELMVDKGVQK
ncbi:glycosyltransferase [Chloroflexota bacterium]